MKYFELQLQHYLTYIWRLLKPKSKKVISFTVTILCIATLFFVLWPIMDNLSVQLRNTLPYFLCTGSNTALQLSRGKKAHPAAVS